MKEVLRSNLSQSSESYTFNK